MILPICIHFLPAAVEEPSMVQSVPVALEFKGSFLAIASAPHFNICDMRVKKKATGATQSIFGGFDSKGTSAENIQYQPLSIPAMQKGDIFQMLVKNIAVSGMNFSAALHGVPAFNIRDSDRRRPGFLRVLEMIDSRNDSDEQGIRSMIESEMTLGVEDV